MGELTWVGHGTVLVEMDGRRLLVDPVLGRRVGPLRRLVPPPEEEVAAGIDAVLISHLHGDHADVPSLRRVGATVEIVAPAGAGRWLARRGFRRVCELRPGQPRPCSGSPAPFMNNTPVCSIARSSLRSSAPCVWAGRRRQYLGDAPALCQRLQRRRDPRQPQGRSSGISE